VPRSKTVAEPSSGSGRGANWETRRQTIVDTSARVFAQGGYHGTGIAELCEANDLGKGALYHYIGSKEELLEAIHDRVMDEVEASAKRVTASTAPANERLATIGDDLLGIIERLPDHVWVFLHEFPALTGDRAKKFHQRRRTFERAVERVIADGVAAGQFRNVDPRLTMLAWYGMHNYTYLWLKPDGDLSAHDVAKNFADLFINGILK
jgi:TetR/AcrR family transcriptional regulator, cholesterol catabolism regulator